MSAAKHGPFILALLVAASVGLVFAPAARFDFVNYDDPRYVTGDPHVRAGLDRTTIGWAFGRTHDNWHPLTSLSHAAVWHGWGGAPSAHHVANVVLHAANAGLVVLAVGALTGDPLRATIVAMLFALHPLRVESVAWVTERKDVLSGFGFLLVLWAYAAWVRRPSTARGTAVLVAFVGALLAKPMVVTLPLVLLVLDWWPLARAARPGRLVFEKMPLVILAAITSVVTVLVQRSGGSMPTFEAVPLSSRLANAAVAYVRYLGATIWPADLAFFYPYRAWPPLVVAGAVVVLASLTAGALAVRRRRPYLLAGWAWWLVMLAPVSGVLQAGEQSMADRYTYLPSLGLLIAGVWWVGDRAVGPIRRPAAIAVGVLLVLVCAWATRRQLPVWQNSETLTRHALAVTNDNYLAHLNLGQALVARGENTEGREHYEAGIRIKPDHPPLLVNRGHAALRDGRPDEAESWFRRALVRRPDLPQAHHGLGRAAAAREDYPAAIAAYERALAGEPGLWDATADLADVLAATGRTDEAIAKYAAVVAGHPTFGFELGNLLFRQGRTEEAVTAWRMAIAAVPEWHDARDNVAVGLLVLGRPGEAIPELARIVAEDPQHQRTHLHLGLALAAVGRRDEAVAALRAAVALRPDDTEAVRALTDLEASFSTR